MHVKAIWCFTTCWCSRSRHVGFPGAAASLVLGELGDLFVCEYWGGGSCTRSPAAHLWFGEGVRLVVALGCSPGPCPSPGTLLLCLSLSCRSHATPVPLERLPDTLIGTPAMIKKKFQIKPAMLYSSGRKHLFINTAGMWGLHYYYFLLTLKKLALTAVLTTRRQVRQSLCYGQS